MVICVLFFNMHALVGLDYDEQNDSQRMDTFWGSAEHLGVNIISQLLVINIGQMICVGPEIQII